MANNSFDVKLRFLAKQLAWIVCFVLISPICAWGIFTGFQYMDDECVKQGTASLKLDWWLIIACTYDLIVAIVILLLLCCYARGCCRRCVLFPLHMLNLAWMGVGVWLIIQTDYRCPHNTLWVLSVVIVSLTFGTALILLVIFLLNTLGLCRRLGQYCALEATPYDYITNNHVPI